MAAQQADIDRMRCSTGTALSFAVTLIRNPALHLVVGSNSTCKQCIELLYFSILPTLPNVAPDARFCQTLPFVQTSHFCPLSRHSVCFRPSVFAHFP
jgi:hypothetical protein